MPVTPVGDAEASEDDAEDVEGGEAAEDDEGGSGECVGAAGAAEVDDDGAGECVGPAGEGRGTFLVRGMMRMR